MRTPRFLLCLALLGCAPAPLPPPTVSLAPPPLPAPAAVPDEGPAVSADPSAPPAARTPPAPPPAVAAQMSEEVAAEVSRSIHRVSDTEFIVKRQGLNLLLENSAVLLRQARLVPEKVGDELVGLRLFGVRPDSTLGQLGIVNGDRIHRISGHDVTDPQHALEAYAALHAATRLVLELDRHEVPMKIVYRVE